MRYVYEIFHKNQYFDLKANLPQGKYKSDFFGLTRVSAARFKNCHNQQPARFSY